MTYKGHLQWFKVMKNFKIGYNKMLINQNNCILFIILKKSKILIKIADFYYKKSIDLNRDFKSMGFKSATTLSSIKSIFIRPKSWQCCHCLANFYNT